MSRIFRITVLFIAGFLMVESFGVYAEVPKVKRYQMSSGIIEYAMEGNRKGTETVYFSEWGMKEARYASIQPVNVDAEPVLNLLTLTLDEWIYSIDLDRKTGSKFQDPILAAPDKSLIPESVGEFSKGMLEMQGGVLKGRGRHLDRDCDQWEIEKVRIKACVWNDIPLKIEWLEPLRELTVSAVRLEENVTIPEDKFAIPPDVRLESEDAFMLGAQVQEQEPAAPTLQKNQ